MKLPPPVRTGPIEAGTAEFAEARRLLDASRIPDSIDDIFVRLSDRFEGFAGAYQNENGHLVLVSTQPESARSTRDGLVADLFDMARVDFESRSVLLSREVLIQEATYTFTELAIYRDVVETNLRGEIPLVLTDVDESRNVVLIGLDETSSIATGDVESMLANIGIPAEAVAFERVARPRAVGSDMRDPDRSVLQLTDYVRPLAGGLQIDTDGRCTLGVPVWYGNPGSQTRGFLTASHCTKHVGVNYGRSFGQEWYSSLIGTEYEDPPLTNCGPSSTGCYMTDVALIDLNSAHDNSTNTLTGKVYLTDYSSSTGSGGMTVTGEPVSLNWTQAPFMGLDVNKVGRTTGWTTGEITGTCFTIPYDVRHPDDEFRSTVLPCAIRTNTPVNVGDSGSALFSIVSDPEPSGVGGLFGIVTACSLCDPNVSTTTYSVSWAAIAQAMNSYITLIEDQGGE